MFGYRVETWVVALSRSHVVLREWTSFPLIENFPRLGCFIILLLQYLDLPRLSDEYPKVSYIIWKQSLQLRCDQTIPLRNMGWFWATPSTPSRRPPAPHSIPNSNATPPVYTFYQVYQRKDAKLTDASQGAPCIRSLSRNRTECFLHRIRHSPRQIPRPALSLMAILQYDSLSPNPNPRPRLRPHRLQNLRKAPPTSYSTP